MWLDRKRVALILLVIAFQCSCCLAWEPPNAPGETLIKGVKFRGDGEVKHLNDKNLNTFYTPPAGRFSYFYADLGGTYNITTIRMWAQKRDMRGINSPFQISTYQLFINPCKPVELLDMMWLMCQYNAKFTEKGQLLNVTCNRAASVGQYFRFSVGAPWGNETVSGPYVAEIWIYGKKMHDGHQTPEPEDGPEVEHVHFKTRKDLLTGVESLRVQRAWAQFTLNNKYEDVALVWYNWRIHSIAARRGSGRIFIVIGTEWLEKFYNEQGYVQLKNNVVKWLTNKTVDEVSFVNADQPYKTGDILVAMRNQTIDVQKIKKAVMDGRNTLIVAYLGEKTNPSDTLTELLLQMEFNLIQDQENHGSRDVLLKDLLESQNFVPHEYRMKLYTQSWKMFRTQHTYSDFTILETRNMKEIKSEGFQTQLKKLLEKYYNYFRDRFPCKKYPYHWDDRTRNAWYNYNLYAMAQKVDKIIVLPGVDVFPGLAKETETPTSYRVTINGPKAGWFYPTGAFVSAGQVFKWKVISHSHNLNNYYFTVSCHKDNVNGIKPWSRWPRYMHRHQLSAEDSYASPIGGVLFMGMWNDNQNITVELENVYRHPWYDIRNQTSVDDWDNERQRYLGVPWMAFMGDAMHTCLPVSEVVKLSKDDMFYAVQYYDNVIRIMHNFRGSNIAEDGFQVFATDVQLSAGWGHSGIPIMGYLPWAEAFTKIRAGYNDLRNGMTHEIGHNLQVSACTFKYGGEVTNNVYHFPVFEHLLNQSGYKFHAYLAFGDWEMKQVAETWKGKTYEGVNLGYYNWLGITFGEGLLMNLFSAAWGNRSRLGSEEAKVNFWLSSMCEETQFNVLPWQELWHFPINEETRKKCEKYRCFFPQDDMTDLVKDIVDAVIAKQPDGCVRQAVKVKARNDILRGMNTIRPQITFFG